ncbi:MAG: hypothetical protein J5589_04050 [Firmicutes bacterium]|nr:hypothetical protein [Bacillota bacterium]
MKRIGLMEMPALFRYREVAMKGKPKHDRFDSFSIRHPQMDVGKRAKIFAPFDALKGFDDAVSAAAAENERLYENGCISSEWEYNEDKTQEWEDENADEMV